MHVCYLNVLLTRHEDEDVSHQPTEVDLQSLLYCCLHIILLRSLKHKTQQTNQLKKRVTATAYNRAHHKQCHVTT